MCRFPQADALGRIVNHAAACTARHALRERTRHQIEIVLCVTPYRCGSRLCRKCKPCVGITWFTYPGNNAPRVICGMAWHGGNMRYAAWHGGNMYFRMDMWVIRMGVAHIWRWHVLLVVYGGGNSGWHCPHMALFRVMGVFRACADNPGECVCVRHAVFPCGKYSGACAHLREYARSV
jgi:hypothetical protein